MCGLSWAVEVRGPTCRGFLMAEGRQCWLGPDQARQWPKLLLSWVEGSPRSTQQPSQVKAASLPAPQRHGAPLAPGHWNQGQETEAGWRSALMSRKAQGPGCPASPLHATFPSVWRPPAWKCNHTCACVLTCASRTKARHHRWRGGGGRTGRPARAAWE